MSLRSPAWATVPPPGPYPRHSEPRSWSAPLSVLGALLAWLLLGQLPAAWLPVLPGGDYLLLHTLLEAATVLVAAIVFWIVWYSDGPERPDSMIWLACALLGAALLDIAHTLSYAGMPVWITPSGAEKAIAFWIAARTLEALGLTVASLRPRSFALGLPGRRWVLAGLLGFSLLVLWGVLGWPEALPRTFIAGQGLTPQKISVEWALALVMTAAAWRLAQQSRAPDLRYKAHLAAGAAVAAIAELALTRYSEVSDANNLLGHALKLLSYTLIYRTVFLRAIRQPMQQLHELGAALAATVNPMCIADALGHIRWVNAAMCHSTGYTASELLNQPMSLLDLGDQAPGGPGTLAAAAASHAPSSGQRHTRRKDGSSYVDERSVTPISNEIGVITGYICVGEDVTERARADTELRQREAQLRGLFEFAPDAIFVIDEQGLVQHANPHAERVFGYRVDELVGQNIKLLMPPAQAAAHDGQLAHYVHTGERHIIGVGREVQARHKDGHAVQIHLTVGEMPLGQGRRFIGFVRDLTERQQAEQEQARLQRQLMQAQKMDALGQLTGGIAHDFNNMLASILGFTHLSLDRHVEDPHSKLALYLREIEKVSERGRDLIARLLTYGRVEADGPVADQAVAPMVQDALQMLASAMPPEIELNAQLDADLPPVRIPPVELQQVLMNLVINARDALAGQGRIDVTVRQREVRGLECTSCQARVQGPHVSLCVSDSGMGIPAAQLPRIFDPFYTTKEVGKGTGLGLAMVQSVVHKARGHVVVDSEPGRGTQVEILLPCKVAQVSKS